MLEELGFYGDPPNRYYVRLLSVPTRQPKAYTDCKSWRFVRANPNDELT
jgi:hypothetical protein